jgi:7,8-dihydropterin-6-yl-methyl-4-(beta-D-ribofuranosyl)aminobenzene 5'-phosphate synthase
MGVDMNNIDAIILSHGHYDHGDGLQYLDGGQLICHPGCFVKRYGSGGKRYIGLKCPEEEITKKFRLLSSAEPYSVSPSIIFLGEIPRITPFESKTTGFVFEDGSPDFVKDDSALALIVDEGIFVVTGCGHAGVVNTLEHAKKVSGHQKISGIMGGFHLKENNNQTRETIKYLEKEGVQNVYPSHCTALPALTAFHGVFGNRQLKTGDIIPF